jgi:hypothetical protein
MKPSSRSPRTPSRLSDSLHKQLNGGKEHGEDDGVKQPATLGRLALGRSKRRIHREED